MVPTFACHLELRAGEVWVGPFPLAPTAVGFGVVLLLRGTFPLMFPHRFCPRGALGSGLALSS